MFSRHSAPAEWNLMHSECRILDCGFEHVCSIDHNSIDTVTYKRQLGIYIRWKSPKCHNIV